MVTESQPANVDVRSRDTGRLLVSCPDRPGIVAAISRFLFENGANIIDSQQHSTDISDGLFYIRIEFQLPGLVERSSGLEAAFAPIAEQFSMDVRFAYLAKPKRMAIFCSRAEHALLELLWQLRAGDLKADLIFAAGNHRILEKTVTDAGVPFFYIPVEKGKKAEAEAEQIRLLEEHNIDTVVLARYMQILSPDFVSRYAGQIINIHHSFLPAFIGANPYQAAHDRGVKLIGATAHYVTADLDAGPIIEQDVQRVDHRHSTEDLRRLGRYIERIVLARAVTWHVEDRVLLHGNKTIVFA
jgi:formyltetrahydrofolate deformylase